MNAGLQEKIKRLEAELAVLQANWPAHSIPPAMLARLDELEEQLETVRAALEPQDGEA